MGKKKKLERRRGERWAGEEGCRQEKGSKRRGRVETGEDGGGKERRKGEMKGVMGTREEVTEGGGRGRRGG